MDITKATITELKAIKSDLYEAMAQGQKELAQVNARIMELQIEEERKKENDKPVKPANVK